MATYYENLERKEDEYVIQWSDDLNKIGSTDRYVFDFKRDKAIWDANPRAELYLASVELLIDLLDDPGDGGSTIFARLVRARHKGNGVGEVFIEYQPNNALGPFPVGPKHAGGPPPYVKKIRVPNAIGANDLTVKEDDHGNPGYSEAELMVTEWWEVTETTATSVAAAVLAIGTGTVATKHTNLTNTITLSQTFEAYKISNSNYFIRIKTYYKHAKWLSAPGYYLDFDGAGNPVNPHSSYAVWWDTTGPSWKLQVNAPQA